MDVKSKPHSDPSRWVTIYPLYINSNKTLAQGRRISTSKAVENPTAQEIYDVLNHAGVPCELERTKMHPREQLREPAAQGRVRAQLRKDDGTLNMAEQFPSREALMLHAAELIPKLKTRQQSGVGQQQQNAAGGSGMQKQKKQKKRPTDA